MMKKILFLIHDLQGGGAEKVLVNLVNNMDYTKFDVTIMTLFDVGINRQFLCDKVHYKYVYRKMMRGNSHLMKLLTPEQLHKKYIKDEYDVEVAYLEGPCARIISGCPNTNTKLVSWIHIEQHTSERAASSFRNIEEAEKCYNRFDRIICVSETVKQDFESIVSLDKPTEVLYNTNESDKIIALAKENVDGIQFSSHKVNLIGVGKLLKSKGFDKLVRIVKRLVSEDYPIHLYILGVGELENELKSYIAQENLGQHIDLLGYQKNPYKYVAKADCFVCASLQEGFSTAATEALIVGTPVCTVEVSGMKEMLGEHNEYGIVTENNEQALYEGIKSLLDDPDLLAHYKKQAEIRGKDFSTEKTVRAVEKMLLSVNNS